MTLYRYQAARQVSDNCARITQLTINPNVSIVVTVGYGSEVGGVFTERVREVVLIPWSDVPLAAQTRVTDLVTAAFTRLRNLGLIPTEAT